MLVSMGADGGMLVTEGGEVFYHPAPEISVVSTVSAGDAMLAGFLVGWPQGHEAALTLGVTVGSATAAVWGLAEKRDVDAWLP